MWMAYAHICGEERISPVVLRVEHHALRTSVPCGFKSRFYVDIEVAVRWSMTLPLHHSVRLVGRNNTLSRMGGVKALEVRVVARRGETCRSGCRNQGARRAEKCASTDFEFPRHCSASPESGHRGARRS